MRAGAQDYVHNSNLARLPVVIKRELAAAYMRREKRLADHKLEEQGGLLHQLMESVPDAICFKDLQLRYLGLNDAECQLLSVAGESEVIGRRADNFLTPERARRWREGEERVLTTGEALIDSVDCIIRKDGSVRWFSVTKAPLRNRDGMITGLVGISRDITERQQHAQIKDEFVSTVSHELRTPLTSIAGSLGLLAAGAAGPLPESAMHLLKIAHGNCERLVRLTNDILDIQHIEREAMDGDHDPVEVQPLVAKAIEANRGFAEKFGVLLHLDDGGNRAVVRADPDRLTQVLTNLLSNAVKFSPRGGDVAITLEADMTEVRLSVRDQGPGIPDSARGRIFEKFFQVDASDSRQKGGTGLGLAIVKQIVDQLGGTVAFEAAPGGGTIFTVVLPHADAQARADCAFANKESEAPPLSARCG
jgi:PAS domain S-box-containing protein